MHLQLNTQKCYNFNDIFFLEMDIPSLVFRNLPIKATILSEYFKNKQCAYLGSEVKIPSLAFMSFSILLFAPVFKSLCHDLTSLFIWFFLLSCFLPPVLPPPPLPSPSLSARPSHSLLPSLLGIFPFHSSSLIYDGLLSHSTKISPKKKSFLLCSQLYLQHL